MSLLSKSCVLVLQLFFKQKVRSEQSICHLNRREKFQSLYTDKGRDNVLGISSKSTPGKHLKEEKCQKIGNTV